jgi:hypothetical protein
MGRSEALYFPTRRVPGAKSGGVKQHRSNMISSRGIWRCLEVSPVQAEIGLHNQTDPLPVFGPALPLFD